eukprot:SAG11_NODE_991_length_6262_cov_12.112607_8_plen_114_part_00
MAVGILITCAAELSDNQAVMLSERGESMERDSSIEPPDLLPVYMEVPMRMLQTEDTRTGQIDPRRVRELVRAKFREVTRLSLNQVDITAMVAPSEDAQRWFRDDDGNVVAVLY